MNYSPVSVPDSSYDGFAFTGEQRDSNGLQYHRARYYDPALGVWASLDPMETPNRYGYVGGNPVNMLDRSGMLACKGEDFPAITLDCDDLEEAMQVTNLPIPQIETGFVDDKIDFDALKNVINTNFGFTIAGFSGVESNPVLECTEIAQLTGLSRIPSRMSLVRLATALTYIAARFRDAGIDGISGVKQYLGIGATVQLVSDTFITEDGGQLGEYQGIVPLPVQGLNVYLGSRIPWFAIIHEMGHLFDKRHDLRPSDVIRELRIGVARSNPIYGQASLPTTDIFYSANLAAMEGRANNSALPEEGWADMFMTWVLDGYGVRIQSAPDTALRAGEIRWRDDATGDNTGIAKVAELYTLSAVKHLTVGGRAFPPSSATDEEKIRYMRPIARVLNPSSGYPSDELEYDQLY